MTYKATGALQRMLQAALDGVKEDAIKNEGLLERINRLETILANMEDEKNRNKVVREQDEDMDMA